MERIEPRYSKSQIKKAGKLLKKPVISDEQKKFTDEVLTNLRGSHFYPINTFRATLGKKLKRIDPEALIAQRLKRTPSIIAKLVRFPTMSLSLMQDIGGLRAVLKNLSKVRALEADYKNSSFNHQLVGHKDYINDPKPSGYRGIHLVYKYNNPKVPVYNGLFVEIQIRTKLQHIWATSVETMGAFLNSPLKSSEGPEEWLDFFSLTSAAFAIIERTPIVPPYNVGFTEKEIIQEVINEAERLNVLENFQGFRIAANEITTKRKGSHHLIALDIDERLVRIKSYGRRKLEEASADYTRYEEEIARGKNMNIVLVATSSVESLRKAYPNYFLDTNDFLRQLNSLKQRVKKY